MAGKPKYKSPKKRTNLSLTPETLQRMDEIAEALNISRSELVEKWTGAWDKLESVGLLGESLACFGK
ncbi:MULTISPECIES: ribbon-helix-helix domain-containing protein [unclassified Okeania]|uniref:Ribbon-helix-helix domain-containing protein n=1 Tax=Okeania hirsuta TaxID=1458930 RepID=A0A3N6PHI5_9CYAN|nr:ribbon-helix-helix domain-containing protein [Okeania sp. SIO1H4]NES87752.1 ribbon-helix-helix domain-containing protein [Okeania sp. SIO2B9]NET23307.1 ribbon-helix-helix domain-containing protein [Okeania sp. SIO1H5]NET80027.1 ribbon-helix-helix domain-containing protein [Okeania sp. SIO1F9]NET97432.1 ribbon-helix-helix domain-containing protein [Okeania sp. SIO1H2]RQH25853.1 ribbon-helix-helix domain-containing protein [Okeania hirsuta]